MNEWTRRDLLAAGLDNVVLTTGVVPLDILAREVDRYVKGIRSA